MTDEPARKKRAGGRAGMKVRAGSAVIDQMPWRIPVNPDAPVEPLDAEGVQRVHKTAMRILRDIDWHNKEALRIQEEELVVTLGGAIWFTAYAREVDSNVETEMTAISALAEIFGETADGDTYSLATDEDDNDESDEPEDD